MTSGLGAGARLVNHDECRYRASAPGKVVLSGEYAVLDGAPGGRDGRQPSRSRDRRSRRRPHRLVSVATPTVADTLERGLASNGGDGMHSFEAGVRVAVPGGRSTLDTAIRRASGEKSVSVRAPRWRRRCARDGPSGRTKRARADRLIECARRHIGDSRAARAAASILRRVRPAA